MHWLFFFSACGKRREFLLFMFLTWLTFVSKHCFNRSYSCCSSSHDHELLQSSSEFHCDRHPHPGLKTIHFIQHILIGFLCLISEYKASFMLYICALDCRFNCILFFKNLPMKVIFQCCVIFLVIATICQQWLYRSVFVLYEQMYRCCTLSSLPLIGWTRMLYPILPAPDWMNEDVVPYPPCPWLDERGYSSHLPYDMDSSVYSLIWSSWHQGRHLVTKDSFQHSHRQQPYGD